MVTKTCCHCKMVKPLAAFSNDKRRKDGKDPRCKNCNSNRYRKYYTVNKENKKKLSQQYKEKNADRNKQYQSEYSSKNRALINERHRKNTRNLEDVYVKKNIVRFFQIDISDINPDLIAEYRSLMIFRREIREVKNGIN